MTANNRFKSVPQWLMYCIDAFEAIKLVRRQAQDQLNAPS